MKKIFTFALLALATLSAWADVTPNQSKQTLFTSPDAGTTVSDDNPTYRIPTLVRTKSGMLVAICDERRSTNGADIGNGRIDLVYRTSTDNGKTWSAKKTIVQGTKDCGYGDAAAVCDSETGDILVMCAGGNISYSKSNTTAVGKEDTDDAIRCFRITGKVDGENITWSTPTDMTDKIYDLFEYTITWVKHYRIDAAFFSSGALCQSTLTKNGNHYRIYGVLCTDDQGSQVVYTDDFGETWSLQAKYDAPNGAYYGTEGKITEAPNGDLLLTARHNDGKRTFNVYDVSEKKWRGAENLEKYTGSTAAADAGKSAFADCNGDFQFLPYNGKYLAIFSVPASTNRENLSIFCKVFENADAYYVGDLSNLNGWLKFQVSNTSSAYSAMTVDANGDIAFFYEENNKPHNKIEAYDLQFQTFRLGELAWNGRVVTLMSSNYRNAKGDILYHYLTRVTNEDGTQELKMVAKADATPDYNYYWVINREPNSDTYYISSMTGDGYIGLNEATGKINYTTDFSKAFTITQLAKWGRQDQEGYDVQNPTEETVGYSLQYNDPAATNTDKRRWVSISEDGKIDKFGHTTQGDESSSVYWTTDFIFTDVEMNDAEGQYGTADAPQYTGWKVKFGRSDDSYKTQEWEDYNYYATVNLPFSVLLPEGMKAYKAGSHPTSGQVYLKELDLEHITGGTILPRETPALLCMERVDDDAATTKVVYLQPADAKTIMTSGFNGTLAKKTFSDYNPTADRNYYILAKKNGKMKFFWMNDQTLAANKAYYVADKFVVQTKGITFLFGDETTDITPAVINPAADDVIYDLSGRRVKNVTKGIYIKNGKKFYVK